jgi:hypothetical protein
MLTVENDSRWENVVRRSVERNYNQFNQEIPNIKNVSDPVMIQHYEDFWYCFETIPVFLYNILDGAEYQLL